MVTAATCARSVMTSIAGESSVTRFGAGRVNVQTPERAGENELKGW